MISASNEATKNKLIRALESTNRLAADELKKIEAAFDFGAACHKDQKTLAGQDYFQTHCIQVAYCLYDLGMSVSMIIAGLLHESLEKDENNYGIIKQQFGEEIAFFVKRLSLLNQLKYQYYKRHVASLRKFLVVVSKDVRVIIIKLCDCYCDLRTLQYLPSEKQKRLAEESMLVYAPLAQKLNMPSLYQNINDLSFPYVFPKDYQKVKRLQKANLAKANKTVENIYRQSIVTLNKGLGYTPKIDRRIKSTYSLYQKLLAKDWDINSIYDFVALRIIVKSTKDCYEALSLIHARWKPIQSRFKDYIVAPKTNGYQSLHTTISNGDGMVIEIQIKTAIMHQIAEFGPAAHLSYKNVKEPVANNLAALKSRFDWLDQLNNLDAQNPDTESYLKELKTDLFANRVFIKTPQGDVIDLMKGSTILDFAFAVHTDLGLTAKGGLINGIYKALKTPLNQEDVVEIVTDRKIRPQKSWLNWIKTPLARRGIKDYLNRQAEK